MKLLKPISKKRSSSFLLLAFMISTVISCSRSTEIVVQEMKMNISSDEQVFEEELLPGEMAGMKIEHIAFVGPIVKSFQLSDKNVDLFLFIKGNGTLKTDTLSFSLVPESIAIPMRFNNIDIEVQEGEELHFVRFCLP